MIVYNMRHRGPLEYDKYVLNAMQFHNEVNGVLIKEFENTSSVQSLLSIQKELQDKATDYTGREKSEEEGHMFKMGYSEDIYLFLLNFKEV